MGKTIVRVVLVGASLFMIGKGILTGCAVDRSKTACWSDNHMNFMLIIGIWALVGLAGVFAPFRD